MSDPRQRLLEDLRASFLKDETNAPEAVQAVVDIAMLMAAADGQVSERDYEELADLIAQLTTEKLDAAKLRTRVAESQAQLERTGLEARARALAAGIKTEPGRRGAFRLAATVALIDGWLDRGEIRAFNQLAKALEIAPEESTKLVTEIRAQLSDESEVTRRYE